MNNAKIGELADDRIFAVMLLEFLQGFFADVGRCLSER